MFFMLLSTFALRRQDRKLRRGGGGAPEAGWNLAHHSEYRQNNYLPNADGSRAYHAPSCTCGLGFHAFKEERVESSCYHGNLCSWRGTAWRCREARFGKSIQYFVFQSGRFGCKHYCSRQETNCSELRRGLSNSIQLNTSGASQRSSPPPSTHPKQPLRLFAGVMPVRAVVPHLSLLPIS